jgi:hypothetical protein
MKHEKLHLNKETKIVRLIALTRSADLNISLLIDLFCTYCHFLRQIHSHIDFVNLSLSNKIFIKNFSIYKSSSTYITDLFPSHHLIRFSSSYQQNFQSTKIFEFDY